MASSRASGLDRGDPVIAELKRLAPSSLAVTLRDGSLKAIAFNTNHRNRWDMLKRTLDSLPWEHIEALDKEGKLVGAPIERDGDSDDSDEGEYDDEPLTGSVVRSILRDAMRCNLEVMRTTMKETRQIFDAQTKSQSELVGVMVEGLKAVQDSYAVAMQVQAAQVVAQNSDGDQGEVMKMMQMAMFMAGNKSIPAPKQPPQPQPRRQVIPAASAKPAQPQPPTNTGTQ